MLPSRTSLGGTVTQSTPPNPTEVITLDEEGQEEEKDKTPSWGMVEQSAGLGGGQASTLVFTANDSYQLVLLLDHFGFCHGCWSPWRASACWWYFANSWFGVTGMAVMVGSSGALETLCGQGFGAKEYHLLGIYLQASCILSLFFSIFISIIWFYTEPILLLLHQSYDIARPAALYVKFLTPGLFAYGLLQSILRFPQTRSVVKPLVVLSAFPMLVHIVIAYALAYWIKFNGCSYCRFYFIMDINPIVGLVCQVCKDVQADKETILNSVF